MKISVPFCAYFFLLVLFGQGCTHNYYAPSLPLSPEFECKGDGMLSAGIGSQVNSTSVEVEAGYAFTNHFFAAGELGFFKGLQQDDNDGKGRFMALTAGWYKLSAASKRANWLYSAPVAVQFGLADHLYYTKNSFQLGYPYFNGGSLHRFRKSTVAPGVAYLGRKFHFHASLRVGTLRFYNLRDELGNTADAEIWRANFPLQHRLYPVVEPGFALSYGKPNLRLQLKWVLVVPKYHFQFGDRNFAVSGVLYLRD